MRLRQLASGHAMGDYLRFMADVAQAQQTRLRRLPACPCPTPPRWTAPRDDGAAAAAGRRLAARSGLARRAARAWWPSCKPLAPAGTQAALAQLAAADAEFLERQADAC